MTKNKIKLTITKINSHFHDQILIPKIYSMNINFMIMFIKELTSFKQNLLIEKLNLK